MLTLFFRTLASATKLMFEANWKISNFRVSFFETPQVVKATAVISALLLRNPSQRKWPTLSTYMYV